MINYRVIAANGDADSSLASAMAVSRLLNQDFTKQDWRKTYQSAFAQLTELEPQARSVEFFTRALQDFQAAVKDGSGASPQDHINLAAGEVTTVRISGSGAAVVLDMQDLPIQNWITSGIAEPAIAPVQEFRELHLPAAQVLFAVGAGAEYGPAKLWLSAGGHLAPVMRPNIKRWQDLISHTRKSAGTLLVPVLNSKLVNCGPNYLDDDDVLAELAGLDVVQNLTETSGWFGQIAADYPHTTLGLWGYAPGPKHIILQAAMDALAAAATEHFPPEKLTLNWLGTPTDSVLLQGLGERQLVDASVKMQGPNYLWAKRAQRWRAELAHLQGFRTAYLVLPPAYTDSVLRHKWLRVAYAGAPSAGIHPFKLELARRTAFSLLVWRLWQPIPNSQAFNVSELAVHGGLWRLGKYSQKAWRKAVIRGLFKPWWRIKSGAL